MAALMTSVNNPRVSIRSGQVKNRSTAPSVPLTKPTTMAAINADEKLAT